MTNTRILLAINVALLLAAPACEGGFSSLGNESGGAGQGGSPSGQGGAVAKGGANQGGTTTSCGAISMLMPQCTNGTAVMKYDASGCPTGYACPGATDGCTCTGTHPMIANQVCADGTTGGPVCATDATTGTCSWIIRSCPVTGEGGATGVGGASANVGGTTGGTCLYNGVTYPTGASFESTDGCNSCSCGANGLVACTLMACIATGGTTGVGGASAAVGGSTGGTCKYNNVTYAAGASFKSTDGCNTCSCSSNGLVACTEMACLATGGTTGAGGTTSSVGGAVAAAGSGGCSAVISMVMPVCDSGSAVMRYNDAGCPIGYRCQSDCICTGPALGAGNNQCSDGTIGGPVCAIHADGTCSWMIRSCPATG
jgi:hypothetical protein